MSSTTSDNHKAAVVEEPAKDKVAAYRQYVQSPSDPERSDEELKALFSSYGWILMRNVINKTRNKVYFYNPWKGVSWEIAAGDGNSSSASGFIPRYEIGTETRGYEITYYNQVLRKEKTLTIMNNLEGDWWLSIQQPGEEDDVRWVGPKKSDDPVELPVNLHFTLVDSGYEISHD